MVQTFEENAKWGADLILSDLSQIMPEDAAERTKNFLESCAKIAEKAKLLLTKIENYEAEEKKQSVYMNTQSSVDLYLYYAQAKGGQKLQKIMTEAYAFVAYLRKWITNVSIDYLVALDNKKSEPIQVLHLTLKDIIEQVNLGVSSLKGFRLSLSPMGMTKERLKDAQHFSNFEKDLKDIENNLIQILQQVTKRANKKNGQATQREMHKYGITGQKLNKGFITETAVNMYAVYGLAAKSIKNPKMLAEAYISTVGNLPGFRGGDINEQISQRFLEIEGQDFQRKVEFQVKRVSGIFGASVIEINTLKYELFNIYMILFNLKSQKSVYIIQQKLFQYFTSGKTAYDVSKKISNELNLILEKELSKTLKQFDSI